MSDEDVKQTTKFKMPDLLSDIPKPEKKPRVKLPSRKETSLHISEFHLTKKPHKDSTINVKELAGVLGRGTPSHAAISRKVQDVQKKTKTLPKPLEKIIADKVKRQSGFEKAKADLGRWDNVVVANKVADQLEFPLKTSSFEVNDDNANGFKPVTEMEKEMYAILQSSTQSKSKDSEDGSYPMTLKEVLAQRKEAASLRAKTAQQQIKAWRRNRIKSKKFHRILRKEKMRQKIKEFETLKETDPEEALKRLELLERSRAQERASLRHKNTGHWARNKAIHAKYDTECRQVLAQQLALGRDLTQKVQPTSDSDSGEDDEDPSEFAADSELAMLGEPEGEVKSFVSGYRKFWQQRNENTLSKPESTVVLEANSETNTIQGPVQQRDICETSSKSENKTLSNKTIDAKTSRSKLKKKQQSPSKHITKCASGCWVVTDIETTNEDNQTSLKTSSNKRKGVEILNKSSKKNVKLTEKNSLDYSGNSCPKESTRNMEKAEKNKKNKEEFEMIQAAIPLRGQSGRSKPLNFPLAEQPASSVQTQTPLDTAHSLLRVASQPVEIQQKPPVQDNIDPTKFLASKPLKSSLAEFVSTGLEDLDDMEETEEDKHRITIAEAFDEDDVVDNFRKEKEELEEASKPKEIDLTLPGWGSWGGSGMPVLERKRKRFILKPTVELPRKDRNKHNVILYEGKDSGISNHQVNSLPYPFTSVKDFEASIRAPIGNTWIPETAHRKLTEPRVVTHQGKIIEPMTEEVLQVSEDE